MLSVDDIVPAFLAACPGMLPAWAKHVEFWGQDERGAYNDMTVIARYLVDCCERGQVGEFPAAFALLERCLAEGDDRAREAATIGIIEDIQNIASHRPFGAEAFTPWLQPLSRSAWDKVAAWWREVGSLADMLRNETGVALTSPMPDIASIQDPELRRMLEGLYRKA
jgi:hypothetical protein